MSEFELTADEKRQVISQRIKNLEVERYNLELTIRLSASEAYKGNAAATQASDQAKRTIEEIDDGIKSLQAIMLEQEETAPNGATPMRQKVKK